MLFKTHVEFESIHKPVSLRDFGDQSYSIVRGSGTNPLRTEVSIIILKYPLISLQHTLLWKKTSTLFNGSLLFQGRRYHVHEYTIVSPWLPKAWVIGPDRVPLSAGFCVGLGSLGPWLASRACLELAVAAQLAARLGAACHKALTPRC